MHKVRTPLSSHIQVRSSGMRSINIERDWQQPALAERYILTTQARHTFARIIDNFDTGSRAWTLTGPYGTGKSYFGLFFMSVMSPSLPAHEKAFAELQQADPMLAERMRHLLGGNGARGFLPVPITGYRASLQEILLRGFQRALEPLSSYADVRELGEEIRGNTHTDSRTFIDWVGRLLAVLTQPALGYRGMILLLDEMGKPLEYAAAHPGASDIYLLQELAEFANRSKQVPFLFMGILHQSFERYAGNLDNNTQREWAKVQGRFEDIAFQEPPDQQIRLLANAIQRLNHEALAAVASLMTDYARSAIAGGWLPPFMRPEEFTEPSVRAYPFHPATLVALPYVFRRLAQNERSLFAYLAR